MNSPIRFLWSTTGNTHLNSRGWVRGRRKVYPYLLTLTTIVLMLAACSSEPPTSVVNTAQPVREDENAIPTKTAPEPQETNRITFISSDLQLGTVSPDGSNLRMLSQGEIFFQFPAYSPNRMEVAVIGNDSQGSTLYLIEDSPQGELRNLYSHPEEGPIYLYWSPDGKYVSFIASHREGMGLHLLSADSPAGTDVLITGKTSFFWTWSPDGQYVMTHTGFTGFPDAITELTLIPIDESEDRNELEEMGHFQAPGISSSGKFYAFAQTDPMGLRWLMVSDLAQGKIRNFQPHEGVVALGWSPEHDRLAYISPDELRLSFYGPLKLIDMDDDTQRVLTNDVVFAFFWSPDGNKIAYLTLASFEEGETTNIIKFDLSVINVVNDEVSEIIQFRPSTVFIDQLMPFFDNYAQSHRIWSPASDALVLPMIDDEGENQIVVVPIDGGATKTIAEGVSAFWSYD